MPDKTYDVGYGKPPRHTRFKPGGPSPNPSGRPRRTPTFLEEFARELDVKVQVQDGGRRRRYTKRQLITKQVVNGAVKGDKACLRFVQALQAVLDARSTESVETMSPKERAAVDRAIFDALAATLTSPGPKDDAAATQNDAEGAA